MGKNFLIKYKNIIFILATALFLRAYGINWGLPDKSYYFSYHPDEVNYVLGLSRMDPARMNFNPHYFNWGTWHYYEIGMAIGAARLFNLVKLTKDKSFYYSHPEEMAKIYLTGRALSVFFALATVFLVYLIARRIYGANAGFLAGLFMSINPAHIVHSHYLKADTSVTFWVALLLLNGIYLLESGGVKYYILCGVFSAMALGSQQNGIWFMHTLFFAHLLREYKAYGKPLSLKKIFLAPKLLYGYLAAFLVYLVVSPYIYLAAAEFIQGIGNVIFRRGGGIDAIERASVLIDTVRAFNVGLTPFFVLSAIAGLIYAILSRKRPNLLISIWLLPYLCFIIYWGALNTRHQMIIFPGLFVLVAGLVSYLNFRISNGIMLTVFRAVVMLACFYAAGYSYTYVCALSKEPPQKEASRWLVANISPKSRIGIPSSPEIRHYPAIVHQDYYYHKGSDAFQIINLNSSVDNLKAVWPEYFIFDEKAVSKNADGSYSSVLMRQVQGGYRMIKSFGGGPSFLNFRPGSGASIPDWEIPFPEIRILERRF